MNQKHRLSDFQNRVFVWQRDVAGQPVAIDPNACDESFYPKQLKFVESEWFDEYIPNSAAYLRTMSEYTDGLKAFQTPVPEAMHGYRIQIADDIGDVAFTLLGLSNVIGENFDLFNLGITAARYGLSTYEASVSSAIRSLRRRGDDNGAEIMRALTSLYGISERYGIGFYPALCAVCDSNDTKLWTREEIENASSEFRTHFVSGRGSKNRIYRVINKDGKLMKSPSFEPPKLDTSAVLGIGGGKKVDSGVVGVKHPDAS